MSLLAQPGRLVLTVAMLALSVLFFGGAGACGCSKGPGSGAPPGDHDASPAPGRGPCRDSTTCDPDTNDIVRSCEADGTTRFLQHCDMGQVCSLGRCVSSSCSEAESRPSITGCLFYTVELDNVDSDDGKSTLIVITNPGANQVTVRLEDRAVGQSWATVQSVSVDGDSAGSFTIDTRQVAGGGAVVAAQARRVVSDAPVTAMLIQSDDADLDSKSSAGTLLLPIHALGARYMAMTYPQVTTPELQDLPGAFGGAAQIAIVATEDQTVLRIWPPGMSTDTDPQLVSLDGDGDLYQIVSASAGADLSGTTIASDRPFAVFSGNVTTAYGLSSQGIHSPDMAMEQMMPIIAWSQSYVAARLTAQTACDSVFSGGPTGLWRFLASEKTTLRFSSGVPIPDLPDVMDVEPGIPYEILVRGDNDFVVRADVPFLATQGIDCEPTLSTAVPADAPIAPTTVFGLPPNFDHEVAMVRRIDGASTPVLLDGADITGDFKPAGEMFQVARKGIAACDGPVERCVHHLTGAYGLTIRGMDIVCSYSVTVPTWFDCRDIGCPVY